MCADPLQLPLLHPSLKELLEEHAQVILSASYGSWIRENVVLVVVVSFV